MIVLARIGSKNRPTHFDMALTNLDLLTVVLHTVYLPVRIDSIWFLKRTPNLVQTKAKTNLSVCFVKIMIYMMSYHGFMRSKVSILLYYFMRSYELMHQWTSLTAVLFSLDDIVADAFRLNTSIQRYWQKVFAGFEFMIFRWEDGRLTTTPPGLDIMLCYDVTIECIHPFIFILYFSLRWILSALEQLLLNLSVITSIFRLTRMTYFFISMPFARMNVL